jgi:hypothetical protein
MACSLLRLTNTFTPTTHRGERHTTLKKPNRPEGYPPGRLDLLQVLPATYGLLHDFAGAAASLLATSLNACTLSELAMNASS